MHATRVLEIWLRRNCPFMHRARLAAVVKMVDGVVFGGKATLAELGRGIRNRVLEKHNVKCADRLIGNAHLGAERLSIYQALAHWLLGSVERPWIIVDWSDVELGREHLMLKAAVPVGGRAVSIYEEVHPLKRYNSPKIHRRFLERLATVVPAHCLPIVITDAGFRGPWFKAVESLGWDWIGRVRNVVKFSYDGTSTWRIEETFRDLESHRWGYGLQYARSRSSERLANLLLVTTLAVVTTWLAGLAAKAKGWARHFQANTVKNRAVLSVFFLGRRILKSSRLSLRRADIWDAARELPLSVNRTAQFS